MDQEKIGKFIADCRKEKGLTQALLAEKLGITDRAVSKWETGKSLPDASIMLELCRILEINVNELLTGERIIMDNYKEIAEENMVELRKKVEKSDKTLLNIEKALIIIIIPTYAIMILGGAYMCKFGHIPFGIALMAVALLSVISAGIVGMQIEHDAGYYECPNCGERYVPTLKAMYMAPHYGTTRKMKCPCCGKRGYHKKVLTRERGGK